MSVEQDLQALQGFLDETDESLQGIETAFIELEKDPGNMDIINTIFRPVHSMKGNSGFFGLTNINKFAHRMEDLLDFIRKGELAVSREIIDVLLTGIDFLKSMMDRVADDSTDIEMREEEERFLVDKVEACKPQAVMGSVQSVIELENLLNEAVDAGVDLRGNAALVTILDQVEKYNQEVRQLVEKLKVESSGAAQSFEENTSFFLEDQDCTDTVQPLAEAANCLGCRSPLNGGQVGAFKESLTKVKELLPNESGVERILDELSGMVNFLDDDLMAANAEYANTVGGLIGELTGYFEVREQESAADKAEASRLGEILLEQKLVSKEQLDQALQKQSKVGEILVKEGILQKEELEKALAIQEKRTLDQHLEKKKKQDKTKTIRIDQNKLDSFVEAVGELFINVDSFNFLGKKLETLSIDTDTMAKFTNTITSLDDMLGKLQDNVMSVRKVPVNSLFQRFPRVIRQLASSLSKDVDFRITGDDTVIDKDLLEVIENPLVHILRNSLDHGLELPAVRTAAGKKEQGVLELTASVDEHNVYLVIRDDGHGIDPDKMRGVAINKGFMDQAQVDKLSDDEAVNLIFKAGFSSAERVSDVSGRGVGMDAVLSGLNKCNGAIRVDSVKGEGTTVTITIPLTRTLVTKDALIVENSAQLFAILSDDITTTVYPDDSMVGLLGDESGISYNGRVLRLIDANSFFFNTLKVKPDKGSDKVIVVCEKHGVALVVDSMYNHQQIVVKVFRRGYKQFRDIPGIHGFTILGNEDIVLIMDVAKMAKEF